MNVLIACEESQTECMAFRARGHNAFSCDILEPSSGHPEWHIHCDALAILNGGKFITMDGKTHYVEQWDLLIAHPPCTYLSNVGARHIYNYDGSLNAERIAKGKDAVEFFMKFYNAKIEKVCIENPIPTKLWGLPPYTQRVQPHDFYGELHPYTKSTCYWLKSLPKLVPVNPVDPIGGWMPNKKIGFGYADIEATRLGVPRSRMRSKSFEGVARAMSEQWG